MRPRFFVALRMTSLDSRYIGEGVLKVLVTGGAGFIGSHVTEVLLARGDQVVCVDNFNDYYDPARKRRNVAPFLDHPAYRLVEADIRAPAEGLAELFAAQRFEKVLHVAAMAGVRYSIQHPDLYAAVNVLRHGQPAGAGPPPRSPQLRVRLVVVGVRRALTGALPRG